jgi:hypothetical protein
VDWEQSAAVHAAVDRASADADRGQLPARDHTVLPARDDRNRRVDPARVRSTIYMNVNRILELHGPSLAGKSRRRTPQSSQVRTDCGRARYIVRPRL